MVLRREFLALVGGAAMAWPVGAPAQQMAKRLGFFGPSTSAAMRPWIAAFVQRLIELGWIEGRNLAIDYRFAEGQSDRYAEIANDYVRKGVDVIVTYGTPPTKAAKDATAVIPIVFAAAADPVGAGLVTSLAQPEGNVTGFSLQQSDIVGKKIELLREMLGPQFRKLAIAGNVDNPGSLLEIKQVTATGRSLGMEIINLEFRRTEDIAPAFGGLNGRAEALYVSTDPFIFSNVRLINALALNARLPTIYNSKEYLEAGGLRITLTCSGTLPILLTKFFGEQSQPISLCNSQQNSILSSTSGRQRRSISSCHLRCLRAPMRLSNEAESLLLAKSGRNREGRFTSASDPKRTGA